MREETGGLKALIESLVFASNGVVTLNALCRVIVDEEREAVRCALNELVDDYAAREGGFFIERVAGGYEFRSRPEFSPWIKALLGASPRRLSRAALETLAMVAYRQPVTRGEVEAIRGVDSGGVLSTLMERRLIKISGRKNTPGRPVVYTTTKEFLEVFDLKDLSSLPSLKEIEAPEEGEAEAEGVEEVGPETLAEAGAEVMEADNSEPAEESAEGADDTEETQMPRGEGEESLPYDVETAEENEEDGSEQEQEEGEQGRAGEGSEDHSSGGDNLAEKGGGADPGGQGNDKREGGGDRGQS